MNARISVVSVILGSLSLVGSDTGAAALTVAPLVDGRQVLRAALRTLGWAAASAIAVAVPATLLITLLWLTSCTLGYTAAVGALYSVLAASVIAWLLLVRAAICRPA